MTLIYFEAKLQFVGFFLLHLGNTAMFQKLNRFNLNLVFKVSFLLSFLEYLGQGIQEWTK